MCQEQSLVLWGLAGTWGLWALVGEIRAPRAGGFLEGPGLGWGGVELGT